MTDTQRCPICGGPVEVVPSTYNTWPANSTGPTWDYRPIGLDALERAVVDADLLENLAQDEMINTYYSAERTEPFRLKYEAARAAHHTARTKLRAARAAAAKGEPE